MMTVDGTSVEAWAAVRRIATQIVGPAADDVDRRARFPTEAIRALREERLLSAAVPRTLGGLGSSMSTLVDIAQILGQQCASTAMIWAMHQIQVAALVRHGSHAPALTAYLRDVGERQLLIASSTSEVGIGGDIRSSIAAVEQDGGACRIEKHGSTISYGAQADAILVTARRAPAASSSDQVLVLLTRDSTTLEQTTTWNTLGMRGTCSPGFRIVSTFPEERILPVPFGQICAETMVPFSHILWSACWLGIATDAIRRARQFLRTRIRSARPTVTGSVTPPDSRLADAATLLQQMRANLDRSVRTFESDRSNEEDVQIGRVNASGFGAVVELNALKIACSELVVRIVALSLSICGMAGYALDGPFSVERHLRDAYSASCMIGNARLKATNAAMLLLQKGD